MRWFCIDHPIHTWFALVARLYLGSVFVLASWHKIVDPLAFALDVAVYDMVPLALINGFALVLPWLELLTGSLLILGVWVRPSAAIISAMMVVFIAALLSALQRGLDISCGCFASQGADTDPIGWPTVMRDAAWLGLGLYVWMVDVNPIGFRSFVPSKWHPYLLVPLLPCLNVAHALAQSSVCSGLPKDKQSAVAEVLASERMSTCCEGTIAECLKKKPTCVLAVRLADYACTRLGKGEAKEDVIIALSRRIESFAPAQLPVDIEVQSWPVLGDDKAPVTLVEYACARCAYCAQKTPELHREITQGRLKGKAKLYFKPFPLRSHPYAKETAIVYVAAGSLGKYWPAILECYGKFNTPCVSDLPTLTKTLGLDRATFEKTLNDSAIQEKVLESKKEGMRNGVEATPTLFINGLKYQGSTDIDDIVDVTLETFDRVSGIQFASPVKKPAK